MSKIANDRLNPVWQRMLYSCNHMATVGVKGLSRSTLYAPSEFDREKLPFDGICTGWPWTWNAWNTVGFLWTWKTRRIIRKFCATLGTSCRPNKICIVRHTNIWYCWLGLLTCKNRRPYNLYCVGADVKPCSFNQSINQTCGKVTLWLWSPGSCNECSTAPDQCQPLNQADWLEP